MSESLLADATGISAGPVSQLLEMGGPVMIVLLAIALAGVVTFLYLMLFGTFFAPGLLPSLKRPLQNGNKGLATTCRRTCNGPQADTPD